MKGKVWKILLAIFVFLAVVLATLATVKLYSGPHSPPQAKAVAAEAVGNTYTDTDCRSFPACKYGGKCAAHETGHRCIAVSDQDCAKSKVCKDETACTAQAGACIATSDVMCAATRGCKQDGRCTATEGSCQLTSMEDCRKSNGCSEEGRCIFFKKKNTLPIFVPGLRQRPDIVGCRADRGSCLQSVVCKRHTFCLLDLRDWSCVGTDDNSHLGVLESNYDRYDRHNEFSLLSH